eukprot:scaffold3087_cov130-Alexandrium_tamarense.AAC.16
MLTSLALRTASRFAPRVVASTTTTASRNVGAATAARRTASIRFMGSEPFAVDAPDGDHDLQDLRFVPSPSWDHRHQHNFSTSHFLYTNLIHSYIVGRVIRVDQTYHRRGIRAGRC